MEPSLKYQFKLMQCVVQINPADGRKRVQCPDHQDLMRYEKGFPPGSGGIVPLRSIPYRLYEVAQLCPIKVGILFRASSGH